ncbi:MAG: DUF4234 domain-containing protein [Myxococcales bacterium]|nr:DUF4234 domain-containing protein [Myxococcales bacterium]
MQHPPPPWIAPRNAAVVLVLGVVTCGLYQMVWYHHIYRETQALAGQTPTGQGYWLDLLLTVITCGIYGIFVDYQLNEQLNGLLEAQGQTTGKNDGTAVILLDVSAYVTGGMANLVTTAIAQEQLNRVLVG